MEAMMKRQLSEKKVYLYGRLSNEDAKHGDVYANLKTSHFWLVF